MAVRTTISYLYQKMFYRVKSITSLEYDVDWSRVHTYEEDLEARRKDNEWNVRLRKYQIEAWAFFGLLIIELDKLFDAKIKETDIENFKLCKEYEIYVKNREKVERKKCSTIKRMVTFMRHGYCHPEESATLRLDPYISDILKRSTETQDSSYHRVHFLKENNKYYVQIGGGKLYFDELMHAIKIANKKLRTS